MTKTIDFCIPFVGNGIRYLEYLINNIKRTASHPDRINIIVSYHTDNDLDVLKKSSIYSMIKQTVMAPAFSTQILFFPSANHASAINTLSKVSTGDIVIFCDYDMAFVYPGWDQLIEDYFFIDNLQICGVTYSCFWLDAKNLEELIPTIKNTPLAKYQNLPNLSFLGIKGDTLKKTFMSHLTHFDKFLAEGGLPFRFINTPALAAENNLPLGAMQWLDTGYELPSIIQEKNIPYVTFPYVMLDKQTVLKNIAKYEQLHFLFRPEVFYCQKQNVPFLCHFKKGTNKSNNDDVEDAFNEFTAYVDGFLNQ